MSNQAMHALLEHARTDTELDLAVRAAFAKADAEAIVRIGEAKGCFVSSEDAAIFVEVATFIKSKELTEAELNQVVGAGMLFGWAGAPVTPDGTYGTPPTHLP